MKDVNLSLEGAQAVMHCLNSTKVSKLAELRVHSGFMRLVKANCLEETERLVPTQNGAQTVKDQQFKPGILSGDKTSWEMLQDWAKVRLSEGLPGVLVLGYFELFEALEQALKD